MYLKNCKTDFNQQDLIDQSEYKLIIFGERETIFLKNFHLPKIALVKPFPAQMS